MNSIVSELTDYIAQTGVATEGVDLFMGHFVPNPDNVLMVFSAGGPAQDAYLDTNECIIDIWARNEKTDVAYDKLLTIFENLHRQQNILLSRFYLYFAQATTGVMDMDRDSNGRKLFKQSYKIIYRDTNLVS